MRAGNLGRSINQIIEDKGFEFFLTNIAGGEFNFENAINDYGEEIAFQIHYARENDNISFKDKIENGNTYDFAVFKVIAAINIVENLDLEVNSFSGFFERNSRKIKKCFFNSTNSEDEALALIKGFKKLQPSEAREGNDIILQTIYEAAKGKIATTVFQGDRRDKKQEYLENLKTSFEKIQIKTIENTTNNQNITTKKDGKKSRRKSAAKRFGFSKKKFSSVKLRRNKTTKANPVVTLSKGEEFANNGIDVEPPAETNFTENPLNLTTIEKVPNENLITPRSLYLDKNLAPERQGLALGGNNN